MTENSESFWHRLVECEVQDPIARAFWKDIFFQKVIDIYIFLWRSVIRKENLGRSIQTPVGSTNPKSLTLPLFQAPFLRLMGVNDMDNSSKEERWKVICLKRLLVAYGLNPHIPSTTNMYSKTPSVYYIRVDRRKEFGTISSL